MVDVVSQQVLAIAATPDGAASTTTSEVTVATVVLEPRNDVLAIGTGEPPVVVIAASDAAVVSVTELEVYVLVVGGQGVAGPRGLDGQQGIQGVTGPRGLDGQQGIQGVAGLDGQQGIQGVAGLDGISEADMAYARRVDFTSDTTIYKAEAAPGSLDTDAVWRIHYLVIGADGDVTESWAGGNANFDKVWANHLALVYS